MSMYDEKASPASRPLSAGSLMSKLFGVLQYLVVFAAVFVVLYLLLVTPHEVDGLSMFPTYNNGEYVLASKQAYRLKKPQRGDVIVYKIDETTDYIKRVIGIPGDSISIIGGKVQVNGVQIDESEYLSPEISTGGGRFLGEGGTVIVEEGMLLTMGDNRPGSTDSREFGLVDQMEIKGEVFLVIYPIGQIRIVRSPAY